MGVSLRPDADYRMPVMALCVASRNRVNTALHAFDGGSGQAWEDGPGEALAAQAGYGPCFPGLWPSWVNSWMTDPPFTVLPSRPPRVHSKLTGRLRPRWAADNPIQFITIGRDKM